MPEPEAHHSACWYAVGRSRFRLDLGFHATIEDGKLLFCAHPMWFPVVGYQFDVRNSENCDYFRGRSGVGLEILS